MKNIIFQNILILSILFFSGCYYERKTRCLKMPQSVHCFREKISDVDRCKKEGISDNEKMIDIHACNVTPDEDGNIFQPIREAYPIKAFGNKGHLIIKAFGECMKSKGYKFNDN